MVMLPCVTGGQSSYNIVGLSVSAQLIPFASLMLTTVLIPRASFLGHLAGIIVGYAAAFGAFTWMTPFWTLSLGLWAVLGAHISITLCFAMSRKEECELGSCTCQRITGQ